MNACLEPCHGLSVRHFMLNIHLFPLLLVSFKSLLNTYEVGLFRQVILDSFTVS